MSRSENELAPTTPTRSCCRELLAPLLYGRRCAASRYRATPGLYPYRSHGQNLTRNTTYASNQRWVPVLYVRKYASGTRSF
eukprot:COSAG06_NODE_2599_length_6600_cov_3.522074_3_plen_81_part_00